MLLAGKIDWGDAPTWFGFIAAGVAAAFAVASFIKLRQQVNEQSAFIGEQQAFIADQRAFMVEQSETLRLERQELLATAEDRSAAQARQVRMPVTRQPDWARARVFNESQLPIRDVEVKFGPYTPSVTEVQARDPQVVVGSYSSPVHLIGPGRVFEFRLSEYSEQVIRNNRAVLEFTDAQGARWALDEHGELKRLVQE
ncbi:hypothetical protein ABT093_09750 [Kitasatospora sp. NPDC002551]|uniref:hypothetical protein n=1 Tax=Kitasatospora sp. NPDC002551 TaxID=3154539 RepID=UPI0033196199